MEVLIQNMDFLSVTYVFSHWGGINLKHGCSVSDVFACWGGIKLKYGSAISDLLQGKEQLYQSWTHVSNVALCVEAMHQQ